MSKVLLGEVSHERKETCKGSKEGYPIVGLEHLIPEEITLTTWDEGAENTFTKMFRKGDVLFGRRRAYLKKAAVAPFDGICSGDITVIEADPDKILPELLPFIIQNDDLFDFAVGKSAGSLSPRVKWEHLKNYEFELPDMDKQKALAELLWAISIQHEAGYICAMLFIIPGFPFITSGIDLAKLDMRSGLERLAYALIIIAVATLAAWMLALIIVLVATMSAWIMALVLNLQPVDFLKLDLTQEEWIIFRLLTSFCGVFGFSIMFNSPTRLAAVAASETGLALFLADVGRSDEPRRAQQIAVAGEHDGVTQPSLLRRAAYRPGQCAVFCRKLGHGALLSSAGPDSPIILMYQYNTGKAGQASFIRRIAGKMFPVTLFPTMNRNQLQKNRKIWE
mgnify:CR=1 FL=1